MVLQVLADARQIRGDVDADRAKMIGGSDARQHQELR